MGQRLAHYYRASSIGCQIRSFLDTWRLQTSGSPTIPAHLGRRASGAFGHGPFCNGHIGLEFIGDLGCLVGR